MEEAAKKEGNQLHSIHQTQTMKCVWLDSISACRAAFGCLGRRFIHSIPLPRLFSSLPFHFRKERQAAHITFHSFHSQTNSLSLFSQFLSFLQEMEKRRERKDIPFEFVCLLSSSLWAPCRAAAAAHNRPASRREDQTQTSFPSMPQCPSISFHSQFVFSFSKRKQMEWKKLIGLRR